MRAVVRWRCRSRAALRLAFLPLAAIGFGSGSHAGEAVATLDGREPLVIAHRGFSGRFPEETQAAYEAAVDAGADSLEEDLHLTKDCVLVARHNPWLSDNTNIATVAKTNATVAGRKRVLPGALVPVKYSAALHGGPAQLLVDRTDPSDPKSVLRSLVVDGEDHTGDWSITDFTIDELKRYLGGTTYDAADVRPDRWNGRFPIVTMQEIIDLARARSATSGRTLTVYPEAKNPYWNNQQAIANGCGTGTHPFEDAIVKLLADNALNDRSAPVFIQSFDPESLKYMRSIGLATRVVQLIDASGVDYRTGELIFRTDDAKTFTDGRPYSWTLAGDPRTFGDMLTPPGLAEIRTYADGIGPWKPMIVSLKVSAKDASMSDATARKPTLAEVGAVSPKTLVHDAHAAGLFVHGFTFRDEARYLAAAYQESPVAEYLLFFRAGVDGVFTDFPTTAVEARALYAKERSR